VPSNQNHPPLTVVLAEDDDGHALLVTKNIERAGHAGGVVRLRDGQEAIDYFDAERGNVEHMRSAILLLDINLPRRTGIEVLQHLKRDTATASLPIIMLTTTDDPQEVARCYDLGCNVYVRKPVVHEEFVDAIGRLGRFLQVIQVPTDVATGA